MTDHPNGKWSGNPAFVMPGGPVDERMARSLLCLADGSATKHPAVAESGGIFLVVAHGQSAFAFTKMPEKNRTPTPFFQIFGVRVRASDGKALDGIGKDWTCNVISDGNRFHQWNPAVAGGKDGQFLVVYEADRKLDDHRIEARFVQAR